MKSATSRDHGQDRHLLVNDDLKESRALSVQEPLHLVLELSRVADALGLDTHSLAELDEVGVLLVSVREAVLEEERLPLGDHTLLLVVQDDDLDTNVKFSSGAQLSESHAERRITIDVDDESIGTGNLSANGGGETVTHGSSTTRGDHGAGMSPAEVLSCPHLVLTNTGSDDGILTDVLSEFAELVDDGLGLDQAVRALLFVGPREALLPVIDLLEPLRTLRNSVDVGDQSSKVRRNVTLDSLGGLDDLVDVLGHDLEVNDTTASLSSSSVGSGSKAGDVSSDTVVETSTKGNDQVGFLHSHVGVCGTVHTQHMQRLRVELVKATKTLEGGGDRDICLVGKLLQKLGTFRSGDNTLPGIDDGLLGDVDQVSGALDGAIELSSNQLAGSQAGSTRVRGEGALNGNGPVKGAASDILRQIDEDGTRTAAGSNLKGLIDAAGQLGNVLDHHIPLGAGSRNSEHVGLLECIRTNSRSNNLTTENNHRCTVHQGILHRCNNVGGTRTGCDEDDTRLSRSPGVTLSHVTRTLLMSRKDEVEVLRVVNGIEDGENGASRVSD